MGIGSKLMGWSQRAASSSWTIWCFLIFGVIVRIVQYASNRSLWLDEATLSKSVVERGYLGLTEPLEYFQFAPLGFLWIERFFCNVIGPNEYGLRFFPLFCGLISIFLFYYLSRTILSKSGTVLAVTFFTCTYSLIYYSAEVKQYSSEVMIAIILIMLAQKELLQPNSRIFLCLVITGIISIFFSFSAFILLAGIGGSWVIHILRKRRTKELLLPVVAGVIWMAVFLLYYLTVLRHYLIDLKVSNFDIQLPIFWPIPPHSISDLLWPLRTMESMINDPLSMKFALPVLLCIILGVNSLWKRNTVYSMLVGATIAVALALSAMKKYPFGYRLILYLVPFLIIWLSEGLDFLRKKLEPNHAEIYLAIAAFFIYIPVVRTASAAVNPITNEEVRPIVQEIAKNASPRDLIYVYYNAYPAFDFYRKKYSLPADLDVIVVQPEEYNTQTILRTISGMQKYDRVWILFSHCFDEKSCLRLFTKYMMDLHFKLMSADEKDGAWLYLYDTHTPDAAEEFNFNKCSP